MTTTTMKLAKNDVPFSVTVGGGPLPEYVEMTLSAPPASKGATAACMN